MGTYKRQDTGIRLNLSRLERDIDNLEQDRQELLRRGWETEAKAVAGKLKQLYAMQNDAVKHGYGYYDYKVTHRGRSLVLGVAVILGLMLIAGYLLVVLR